MRKLLVSSLLLLVWMCSGIQVAAQEKMPQIREDGAYYYVDKMPEYKGGIQALMQYIKENVKYPAEAHSQKISGKVLVQFIVNKQGKATDFKVIKSAHPLLDAEALRVLKAMPEWTPGKDKGKNVDVIFTIPVGFNLVENKEVGPKPLLIDIPSMPMKGDTASLQGVWQMCASFDVLNGKYRIRTAPFLKILASDKTFLNLFIDGRGGPSTIVAYGTYQQTAKDTYIESVTRSYTNPQFSGVNNEIHVEFVTENILSLSFCLPGQTQLWKEMWIRVSGPEEKYSGNTKNL